MVSTTPSTLPARLNSLLTTLDSASARLSAILSTSVGVDKFLLTVYYTLKLLYPQIARLRALRLRLLTPSLAKTAPALMPGPAVLAVQQLSSTDAALAATDAGLRNLAALVSEFRTISRLWGLLGLYRWARGTWAAPPPAADKHIVWAQIVACVGYQALENVAYLAGKGVIRGEWVSAERQGKMWVWSCRAWFVHCVLEGVRLVRERQRAGERKGGEEKEDKIKAREERAAWNRAWYANAAYTPVALHYSFADGLIGDEVLGGLGLVVAYNSFGHLWRQSGL